jgi:hypothetical protein
MRSVIFKTQNNLYKIRTDDKKSFFWLALKNKKFKEKNYVPKQDIHS